MRRESPKHSRGTLLSAVTAIGAVVLIVGGIGIVAPLLLTPIPAPLPTLDRASAGSLAEVPPVLVTRTAVAALTPTRTPIPSAMPSPTPSPSATLVPPPTSTATSAPTPTPKPTRAPCSNSTNYDLSVLTEQATLSPPLGSQVSSEDETLQATWRIQNTGMCPWSGVRFAFDSVGQMSGPSTLPRLRQQVGGAGITVVPGEQIEVLLPIAASDVLGRALDWNWTVLVETTYGVWLDRAGTLALVSDRLWVTLPTPTPRPVLSSTPYRIALSPPAPPRLLEPNPPSDTESFAGEVTFTSWDAQVTFRWEQDGRPLVTDEYYVVAITHSWGIEYRWAGKQTEYRPPLTQEGSLGWLSDFADDFGRLRWRVLVVRTDTPKETGELGTDDEIVSQSPEATFRWIQPRPSDDQGDGGPGGGIGEPDGGID